MIIDYKLLSDEALINIVDSYILAELAGCNEDTVSLEQRRKQVLSSLEAGKSLVEYSEAKETVYIVSKEKFE